MATGLVTAWRQRRRAGELRLDPTPRPFDPATLTRSPPDGFGLESVIGVDNSVEVTAPDDEPFRPLCMLRVTGSDGNGMIGSGLLIKPRVILTAAHNVYSLKNRTSVRSIEAAVGHLPDGSARAAAWGVRAQCPQAYTECPANSSNRFAFDYALIHLASDDLAKWVGEAHIPDVANQSPLGDTAMKYMDMTVAGYPWYPDKELRLRRCDGNISSHDLLAIFYKMDTMPGESGGPVFTFNKTARKMNLAGVHTTGLVTENRARRFDNTMKNQINKWLAGTDGSHLTPGAGV